MEKLKKAILWKNRRDGLVSYISLVEENKTTNPNASLDWAKSILESISKTILSDKSIPYRTDTSIDQLVKMAFTSLPVFTKLTSTEIEKTKSLLGSFCNISKIMWEFRNIHGFFSHGQDLEWGKFDGYLLELVISSSDLLASFLVISHAEDLKDRSRMYYEEHNNFNSYIDEISNQLEVTGVLITPSKALFTDIDAYKEARLGFEDSRKNAIKKFIDSPNFATTHIAISELEEFKDYMSLEEIISLLQGVVDNQQINRIISDEDVNQLVKHLFEFKKDELPVNIKEKICAMLDN